jgi:CubicO group peptidase (beta-lactamase class C family)
VTNATKKLNALFDTFGQRADVSELKVELFRTSDSLSYKYAAADSKPTHFIASSTKLMASALIDILEARGLISKKGPIGEYIDAETKALVSGLKDESLLSGISVDQLLRHTSGLPDYRTPRALMKVKDVESFTANSLGLDFAAMLQIAKERGVGDAGRAFQYSGVNYQILGKMVEHVTGLSVEAALKEHIFRPLQMTQTKLFKLSDLQEFHDHSQLLVRDQRHLGPRRLAGSDLEGGVTSTTSDTLKFMRGYFEGSLVTEENRQSAVANPRPMLPGISMGAGIMRLKFPKALTGFRDTPEFFGHIGMTSHLMFYSPEEQLHIIFTANQIGKPGINVAPLPKLLKILLG